MPDNTIDSLDIQVSSSTTKAIRALENLEKSLGRVDSAFKTLNVRGVRTYARDIGKLSAALNAFNRIKVDTSNFETFNKRLKNLGNIDPGTKLDAFGNTTLPKLSRELKDVNKTMSVMSNINFKNNGLNSIVNSLGRLANADLDKFNTSVFYEIIGGVNALASMPDVSGNVNRFVSSISRLANAGTKTKDTTQSLPLLGRQITKITRQFSRLSSIDASVGSFVQSIARLASAGDRAGKTASSLQVLAQETMDFFKVMQNAPKISENTIRMTEALSRLASAGGNVGKATTTVSSAMNRLSKVTSKASSIIKSGIGKIWASFKKLGSSAKDVNKLSISFGSLAKSALSLAGVGGIFYGLTRGIGSAVELGSSITEVENVVDVAFGNMSEAAYNFASTAKEQFGLSELASKQYSGTMMAMLKSSGVINANAAEMSTSLAGLAGDLASFYNISTDDAFEKIRSGISGTVAPLRQLGISMTVANLEQYALTQGITKSYREMSQAEKVMLRYNYLMHATSQQQGDFARTVNTFANQWRLLKLNIQSVGAVLGQGFIAAILPVVKALNFLMAKLMQAAETFRDFMYVLTGYKGEGAQGAIVDDLAGMDDVAVDMSDASDGMDDASKSAKKLKKSLSVLSFDQLNQLSAAAEDASDSMSNTGLGGFDLGDTGLGEVAKDIDKITDSKVVERINKWASQIRDAFIDKDWARLGRVVAQGINNGFQDLYDVLNWNNVGPKINKFTDAFTRSFNSFVYYLDFDGIGRTVGTGVNTIVNTLNGFATKINWKSIGSGLASGVNGLFDEINWQALGELLGNGFMIPWDMLHDFILNVDAVGLGNSVASVVKGIFAKVNFIKIGKTFAKGVNKIFDVLRGFNQTFTPEDWDKLAEDIATGFNDMIGGISWTENAQALDDFLDRFLGSLRTAAETVNWEEFGRDIGTFLSNISWLEHLGDLIAILKEVLGGIFKELGKTLPGFLLEGILLVNIGLKLMPFIRLIKKFFTGPKASKEITDASQTLFEKAVGKGAENAAKKLTGVGDAAKAAGGKMAGFLTTTAGTALATGGVIAGLALLGVKIAEVADAAAGGNGELTELGGALDTMLIAMGASKQVTQEQKDSLFDLKEELEDAGATTDVFATSFAQKFKEMGFSANDVRVALENMMAQGNLTSEQMALMTSIIEQLGKANEDMATKSSGSLDVVVESYKELYSAIDLVNFQTELTDDQISKLNTVLYDAKNSEKTAEEAYLLLASALEDMGVEGELAAEIIKSSLPEALEEMGTVTTTTMDKMTSATQEGMETASGTVSKYSTEMKDQVTEDMGIIGKSVADTTADIASDSESNWSDSSDSVYDSLMSMDDDTRDMMNNVLTTVQSKWSSVLINTNQVWEKASQKVANELIRMKDSADVSTNLIVSKFSTLGTRIQNSVGNLYNVGRQAAASFRDGFTSVYIPTPHLYTSSWTRHYTNAEKTNWYSTPNYAVSWYKHGGLFNGASVIGVGEAGREAVLPLENKSTMRMIAESILSNAPTNAWDVMDMMNAVAAGVSMAMSSGSFNNNYDRPIEVVTYLDGREIARSVNKANRQMEYAMNP